MMKSKYLFGALAAMALGLTACSSEEPGPDESANFQGTRYMAVNIRTIGDTKALPDDATDFEEGIGQENAITTETIRFYFFTADGAPFLMQQANVNGTVTNTNMVKPLELSSTTTNGQENRNISGVLVLGTASHGYEGETPSKVIAVANPKQTTFESLSNISISDFQGKTAVLNNLNFDTFSMTSSTYLDGANKIICYTDVSGHIYSDAGTAKTNPAQIYLERLAAKVRVTGLGTYNVKKKEENGDLVDAKFMIRKQDGAAVETTVQVELQGWRLINRATSTYALKNIAGLADNEPFPDWNDSGRHRCYWANTSANAETHFVDKTFDLDNPSLFTTGNYDPSKPTENIIYTYGNTRYQVSEGNPASDRSTMATGIVVKAVIKDEEGDPIDLVRWGAEYFTLDYFKQVVINAWNTTEGNTHYEASDVQLVEDGTKKNYYKVQVAGNDFGGRFTDIYWWKNGVTTYRSNILHYDGADKKLLGVVRNHIYDYKFTNVIGLGLPGEDPVNPPTLVESYLAAVVNVLNWRIISNETVLE